MFILHMPKEWGWREELFAARPDLIALRSIYILNKKKTLVRLLNFSRYFSIQIVNFESFLSLVLGAAVMD